ncbi:MAG: FAD-binding oxidoreductase [Candidatus Tectomicrobia bacterium]|uniref:FAD-binding oxidoreductase n=1 Tax=Tectimicrobiota bacterium TaxID=2528274 RepID=A0A933GLJ9_UNCTE|nr:FAD-binding oxidoreductase [Candidatus Tectomicrobia bacterium]
MTTIGKAQVIIIGGGVIGTSIAYHLTRKGIKDVILIEKELILGMGSTGRSVGGIRQQFSQAVNVLLTQESLKEIETFSEVMEVDLDFSQNGYLLLATKETELDEFKRNVKFQKSLGVDVHLLNPTDIQELVPGLNCHDVLGGTFCPKDGYVDPYGLVYGYSKQTLRHGGKILFQTEAIGIKSSGSRVKGVITNRGFIEGSIVVNAAGPKAGGVAEMFGLRLPAKPLKRQVFVTGQVSAIRKTTPMVITYSPPFYFRPESGGLLLSLAEKEEVGDFNLTVSWDHLEQLAEITLQRLPLLDDIEIIRGWAGLRTLSPDQNAIVGEIPNGSGFYCAMAFSGHGIMHAPVTGKLVAEMIAEGKASSLDIKELNPERFTMETFKRDSNFEASVI